MAEPNRVIEITGAEEFERTIGTSSKCVVLVHFWADWSDCCAQMNEIMEELSKSEDIKNFKFLKVEVEKLPEISKCYRVETVPTFVFLKDKVTIDVLIGASPSELTTKVKLHDRALNDLPFETNIASNKDTKEDLNTRLKKLLNAAPCMVFMKGSAEEPLCGFSKKLVQILKDVGASFKTFDILQDEDVRQGLKTYSNWPTYPQVYVDGELIGGLDIVQELKESNELASALKLKH